MSAAKRPRGRPPMHGEPTVPFQVRLPPKVAIKLRDLGNGSISQGIIKAAAKVKA